MKNFRHFGFLTIFLSVFMVCSLSAQTRSASAECEITQGKQYFIKVKGNNKYVRYLGSGVENQFAIADLEAGDSFKFTFIETEESDVYNIAVVGTEGFLSNVHDGWRLGLGEDQGTNGQIRVSFDDECFITLSGMWNGHDGNYIGLDDNIPELWGNKTAEHWWELEEVREIAPCGVAVIDTDKEYRIKNVDRGQYLRYYPEDESHFGISVLTTGNEFTFTFTLVDGEEGIYNIGSNGEYINTAGDNIWNLVRGTETGIGGQIKIEVMGEDCDTYIFSGLWTDNKYFNLDGDKVCIYSDKSFGTRWVLEPVVEITCEAVVPGDYNVKHAPTGLYMQYLYFDENEQFCINPLVNGDDAFKFTLTLVDGEEDVFNIATNGRYINHNDNWRVILGDETNENGSIRLIQTVDCSVMFSGLWNNMIIGFDGTESGSYVYGNKSADEKNCWILEKIAGTGAKTIAPTKTATVYPTLSKGNVTITTPQAATVKVYDLSGKVLDTYVSNGNITIDMNYANGLYFIEVKSDSIETHKVILQK